ncbi:MAG: SRPBCC family protein [Anaerolineales bacterium]|nr:SRPBCC family protein [Anaerolineales bacterium]MDP2776515.1 SRPBCC family protein [Anaerolineales bacterium]
MTGFNMSEWVARPPKEVFDFIAASENAPKIVNSVTSMVKLTEGPPRVGTRYRETRLMSGKEQQAELEIVEFEPTQKYAVQNVTSGIETVYRYNFQPERDGTRIDLVCEVKAKGIKKLMLPLVASILKKEDGDHLQRVKKVLEE